MAEDEIDAMMKSNTGEQAEGKKAKLNPAYEQTEGGDKTWEEMGEIEDAVDYRNGKEKKMGKRQVSIYEKLERTLSKLDKKQMDDLVKKKPVECLSLLERMEKRRGEVGAEVNHIHFSFVPAKTMKEATLCKHILYLYSQLEKYNIPYSQLLIAELQDVIDKDEKDEQDKIEEKNA